MHPPTARCIPSTTESPQTLGFRRLKRSRNDRLRAYLRGRLAETLCRWLLRSKGYHILEKGYRTKVGEIDILATAAAGWSPSRSRSEPPMPMLCKR
ncbi:MAG: YraN family protein [Proteobacteria bacterium]|nr:YraN family protein [Pseudomonadota bacterium]